MTGKVNPDLYAFLAGLVMFGVGLALIYPPAGLIGTGTVVILLTVFGPKVKV